MQKPGKIKFFFICPVFYEKLIRFTQFQPINISLNPVPVFLPVFQSRAKAMTGRGNQ